MSRLEELIEKLCPDGVEYKLFNEVAQYVRGVTYAKNQEINDESDGYKLLRANNITLSDNTLNFEDIKIISTSVKVKDNQFLQAGDTLICAGSGSKEHIGKVAYIFEDTDYTFGGFMGVVRVDTTLMNPRYMFHFLTGTQFKEHLHKVSGASSSTINNINNETWRALSIPVPPLEVQREIVRVLDSFTLLTAELTAELTARRKQYETYKNQLLSLEDTDYEVKSLGEVCSVVAGGTPKKTESKYWDNGTIKWLGSTVCQNKKTVESITNYITDDGLRNSSAKLMKKNTTLVALVGATIGKLAYLPFESSINQNIAGIYPLDESLLLPEYVYYACTTLYDKFLSLGNGKLAMANLSFIRGLTIKIPSIEKQEMIVNTLNDFDHLCNDITSGLPAEIEARQKQYEYYRDKLLTFKEKN